MRNLFLAAISIATILFSCSPMKENNSADTSTEKQIVNKYWKLTILEGKAVKMTKSQEKEQFFILKSDGKINGFAGCNNFNGAYKLEKGNRIRIDKNLAVTMKLCNDAGIKEREFLEVFNLADNYNIKGDTLNLNVGRRAPLAIFEAVYF